MQKHCVLSLNVNKQDNVDSDLNYAYFHKIAKHLQAKALDSECK